MEQKKYRVHRSDGKVVIIEAESMEKAITIAKSKFGKLPNEINIKIVSDISDKLSMFSEKLIEDIEFIEEEKRTLNWNMIYDKFVELSNNLEEIKNSIMNLSHSMVKINKEVGSSE